MAIMFNSLPYHKFVFVILKNYKNPYKIVLFSTIYEQQFFLLFISLNWALTRVVISGMYYALVPLEGIWVTFNSIEYELMDSH